MWKQLSKWLKNSNDRLMQLIADYVIWVFIFFIIIVLLLPRLFIGVAPWPIGFLNNTENAGQIGDAIGGMTAPIIGLFSAFLVYIAFKAQIKANEELRKQNDYILFDKYRNLINELNNKFLEINIKINKNGEDKIFYGKDSIKYIFRVKYQPSNKEEYNRFIKNNKDKIYNYFNISYEILNEINLNNNLLVLEKKYLFLLFYNLYIEEIPDKIVFLFHFMAVLLQLIVK